jgi:hypothetical protein
MRAWNAIFSDLKLGDHVGRVWPLGDGDAKGEGRAPGGLRGHGENRREGHV